MNEVQPINGMNKRGNIIRSVAFAVVNVPVTFVALYLLFVGFLYGHYEPPLYGLIPLFIGAVIVQVGLLVSFAEADGSGHNFRAGFASFIMAVFLGLFLFGSRVPLGLSIPGFVAALTLLFAVAVPLQRAAGRISYWLRVPVSVGLVYAAVYVLRVVQGLHWVDDF